MQVGFPRTAGEVAANVMPVNAAYPPGNVDRYGTNATPGTSPMSAAFNAAVAVAKQGDCAVVWGDTSPYLLDAPIDCTAARGIVFNDASAGNASAGVPSLIVAHTGHGFDLSASSELVFNDVAASSLAGTVPTTLFFMARDAAAAPAGQHRFDGVRTPSGCTFEHVFYSYGSEGNNYNDCFVSNSQPGSSIFHHNATNPSGYTSSFVTIATGTQPNTVHRHVGGDYFQLGNSGATTEVVFLLEAASNFTFRDGQWSCPHGLAYIRVTGAGLATSYLTVDSVRGDRVGTRSTYAIEVDSTATTGAASHVSWTLNNLYAYCAMEALHFADTAEVQILATRATASSSGKLLSVYNMSNSFVEALNGGIIVGRAGGTVARNTLVGTKGNITLAGTDTFNTIVDTGTYRIWTSGIRFPTVKNPSTDPKMLDDYEEGTFTPTLTIGGVSFPLGGIVGSYTKVGRLITVFVQLTVIMAGASPGGTVLISSLPYTAGPQYRLAYSRATNLPGIETVAYAVHNQPSLEITKVSGPGLAALGPDMHNGVALQVTATYETA